MGHKTRLLFARHARIVAEVAWMTAQFNAEVATGGHATVDWGSQIAGLLNEAEEIEKQLATSAPAGAGREG